LGRCSFPGFFCRRFSGLFACCFAGCAGGGAFPRAAFVGDDFAGTARARFDGARRRAACSMRDEGLCAGRVLFPQGIGADDDLSGHRKGAGRAGTRRIIVFA
jgi:hypothetical protein